LNERTVIGKLNLVHDDMIVCNLDELCEANSHVLASIRENNNVKLTTMMQDIEFGTDLGQDEKSRITDLIKTYADVFAFKNSEKGRTNLVEHKILTTEVKPIKQSAYKQAHVEKNITRLVTNDFLEQGIIQHSCSPWSSPVVLVRKKDGNTRFCVDYRKLNSVTKRDNYPLPRIDDALDRLSGAQYFSSMDCDQAYYQVPVAKADVQKTAFITPDGLFEFKYMPFGLCNAPATFQRLLDVVLGRLKWTIALVYLDDIVVYSRTFEEHLFNLAQVFDALRQAGLKLKPSKCTFADNKLLFLGHIISRDGVSVNPEKVKAVRNFPQPKCRRDVLSLVALCSYYRRFICNFAKIAKPLHKLTEKVEKFIWNEEANAAFEKLKDCLCSSEVLAYPDDDAPTEIHCDASGVGLGATLVQTQNNKPQQEGITTKPG